MHIIIFVTAKDIREARTISQALVRERLVACANIIQGVESIFWWDKKVDNSKEVLLILKTQRKLFKKVKDIVQSLHSYSVPEIIALPIVEGNRDYLKWIDDSLSKA